MDDYCNQGEDDNSGIQNRALGVRYVRYNWCANKPCMCALDHYNIIFLLEYSSVYSLSWLQRVFYYGCSHVLEKFVRISGVYVHTGIRRFKRLFRGKINIILCIIKLMQYKWYIPTSIFNNLFNMYLDHLFTFHLVDLGEFLIWKVDPHTKKWGHPWLRLMAEVKIQSIFNTGAYTFRFETLPPVSPYSSFQSALFTWYN